MTRGGVVILLPGLWMPAFSMSLLARRLRLSGYHVVIFSYRSMRDTLDASARRLAACLASQSPGPVHVVAHSMGGIVALRAASAGALPDGGRIVLLGTPVGGCHAARRLARWPGGRTLLGRAMPTCMAIDAPLPTAAHVGVIAGDGARGLGRLVAPDLPLPNDGVIAVEETRLPAAAHLVLHVSHSVMPFSRPVARAVDAFLTHGHFDRTAAGACT